MHAILAVLLVAASSGYSPPGGARPLPLPRRQASRPPRHRAARLDFVDWLEERGGTPFLDWFEERLARRREVRTHSSRPKRIILVRHGQSEGNTDKTAYSQTPDSQIALTERGWAQGAVAGIQIRQLVGNESVRFFFSPYLRARQTLLAILQAFDGSDVMLSSEPRLREQDFGNFQEPEQMDAVMRERQSFGRFYYRFPNGEAGTDVFDRMASFITYLFRTMGQHTGDYFDTETGQLPRDEAGGVGGAGSGASGAAGGENYILVTHGLLMRIFCMCYLRWTVNEFEEVWNPSNCEIWVLEKARGRGTYELKGRWRASPYGGRFTDVPFGTDRKTPMYEHMKRPVVARPVRPGAPDALDSTELNHLRDLPGPRVRKDASSSSSKAMLEKGDAILAYWRGDTEWLGRRAKASRPKD